MTISSNFDFLSDHDPKLVQLGRLAERYFRDDRHEPQEASAPVPRRAVTVRRRSGRKRALGTRAPMAIPQGPNQRWSLDFLSDPFTDDRRFRILAIVDNFTCECLALVPDTSLPGLRVVCELNAVIT